MTHVDRPLKQGWILKKRGSSRLVSQWAPKYLVLLQSMNGNSASSKLRPLLQVFDQCDQSKPPKHLIFLDEAEIELQPDDANVESALINIGKRGYSPFTIYSQKRKFHFSSQASADAEDWLNHLLPLTKSKGPLTIKRSQLAKSSTAINNKSLLNVAASGTLGRAAGVMARQDPLHRQVHGGSVYYAAGTTGGAGYAAPHPHARAQTGNNNNFNSRHHLNRSRSMKSIVPPAAEDDSASVYSFDDAVSVVSSMASHIMDAEDVRSSASSTFETLSFCSEPVLTPQELTSMGNGNIPATPLPMMSREDTIRRRKAPIVSVERTQELQAPEKWNDKYQRILSQKPTDPESLMRQDVQLMELIGAFQEAAAIHATKMIDEYHLQPPRQNKTGKADEDVPGAVSVDGMILHFACDYDVASPDEITVAHSRTSSELRSINSLNQTRSPLQTALMCLFDYKGFRVVAYADMGIDSPHFTTTFDLHSQDPQTANESFELMSTASKLLNLKTHNVQIGPDRRTPCPLSSSVEMHKDNSTGRSYIVNLFEMFPIDYTPPESGTPSSSPSRRAPTPSVYLDVETPESSKRLRGEFLVSYASPLSSDAFTPASGCGKREKEANDSEAARASRFLRETWVPEFVKRLDSFELRPGDSKELGKVMHKWGVNVRYLGSVARLASIPEIKDMACIEMVGRAFKAVFQTRLRALIVHFRSVGATNVEEEMRSWTANIFSAALGNAVKSERFFEEKLRPEIQHKFAFDLSLHTFKHLHRPAMFLSMQHHTGVRFKDTTSYNFQTPQPCTPTNLIGFTPKRKLLNGLPNFTEPSPEIPEDARQAYHLARHFKSLGPRSKLTKSDESSWELTQVAAFYNYTSRPLEASRYASAAAASASKNNVCLALALSQLLEAQGALQKLSSTKEPPGEILSTYEQAVGVLKFHMGSEHPYIIGLHDRLSLIYLHAGQIPKSLGIHQESLRIATSGLGKQHPLTAVYFIKLGVLLHMQKRTEDSISALQSALHILQTQPPSIPTDAQKTAPNANLPLQAEIHSHLARAFDSKGDLDTCISHAQSSKKLYEHVFGQSSLRSVGAYLQLSSLVLKPYESYNGVLTPAIRSA
ncbi:hypothetical protein HDV05_004470, partial [Chytridiales sp. JEL 0842]